VRTLKIATIETAMAQRIGAISAKELASVRRELSATLGL
jgi:hypothetical protein